jgi:antitoxin YefM
MESISYTAARSQLAKTMSKVCKDHAPIAITRKGEGAVVMLSMEDYQALEETAYLLRSPKNARRLVDALAELESGGGSERHLSSEAHLRRARLGELLVLAENKQAGAQANQPAHPRNQS